MPLYVHALPYHTQYGLYETPYKRQLVIFLEFYYKKRDIFEKGSSISFRVSLMKHTVCTLDLRSSGRPRARKLGGDQRVLVERTRNACG